MSVIAERRLKQFQQKFGKAMVEFATHAALPVVLNSELVHLLRINFFYSDTSISYLTEAEFLLSSFCREIGEDLYEIEPAMRTVLLQKLYQQRPKHIKEIAALLWQYTKRYTPWRTREGLQNAQLLTALNFLDAQKASAWFQEVEALDKALSQEDREWFVAMKKQASIDRAIQKPPVNNFYNAMGGTLPSNAPSYIPRQADTDLYQALKQSEYCYVLTIRQMGKSSLIMRVASRLRENGIVVVVFGLDIIGINVNVEQWYEGLVLTIGSRLNLEDELDDFWYDNEQLVSSQRFIQALRQIVLSKIQQPVIIFVDEIDVVRSLPFSTDEFFAAIQECYNSRALEPNLQRLTFCLIGVSTPSDLIADPRMTPFTVGKRIDLTDFTEEEVTPLAIGLQRNDKQATVLLKRIFYWTNGHPYLTQKLCQMVADDNTLTKPAEVDRLCEKMFFSRSRNIDINLQSVRFRILSNKDTAALLNLYRQIHNGKKIRDDNTNDLINTLRLSGLVQVWDNYLQVRNRIYYRVFDEAWINRKAGNP